MKNKLVFAGAGAGKTTYLIQKVKECFKEGQQRMQAERVPSLSMNSMNSMKPMNSMNSMEESRALKAYPRILLTTFARKATRELKERIYLKASESRDFDLWERFKKGVHVTTLHGLLFLFLKRHSEQLRLGKDLTLVSGREGIREGKGLLQNVLEQKPRGYRLLEEYSGRFYGLCTAYFEAWCFSGESLHSVSQKDFHQLSDFVYKKVSLWVQEILQVHPPAKESLSNSLSLLEQRNPECLSEMLSEIKFLKKVLDASSPLSKTLSKTLYKAISDDLKKMNQIYQTGPEEQDVFLKKIRLFEEIAKDFSKDFMKHKLETGRWTVKDLEPLSCKLIQQYPEAALAFSRQWDYWLVDEYQDVSPVQVRLMEKLRQQKPFFVVGDPQQSIYSFRGASSEVFKNTKTQFKERGWGVEHLKKNYRSHPELVSFFNFIFPSLDEKQFHAMEAAEVPAKEEPVEEPVSEVLEVAKGKPAVLFYLTPEEEKKKKRDKGAVEEEVFAVLTRIQELLEGEDPVQPNEVAVLARTRQQLRAILREALQRDIPVQWVGFQKFYESREVQDALALLKFLINPHDNFNLIHLLRSPTLRLKDNEILDMLSPWEGETSASSASSTASASSYWQRMKNLYESQELLPTHPFSRLNGILSLKEKEKLSQIFIQSLVRFNMLDICAFQDSTGKRETHLWKLVCELSVLEKQPDFDYLHFIAKYQPAEGGGADKGGDTDTEGEGEEGLVGVTQSLGVQLMTIHKAKGLEYEHVILPFLSKPVGGGDKRYEAPFSYQQNKWSIKCKEDQGEGEETMPCPLAYEIGEQKKVTAEEEENRLMYVACTRAKKTLTLTFTVSDKDKDKAKNKAQFLRRKLNLEEEGEHREQDFTYSVCRKRDWKACLDSLPPTEGRETEAKPDKVKDKMKDKVDEKLPPPLKERVGCQPASSSLSLSLPFESFLSEVLKKSFKFKGKTHYSVEEVVETFALQGLTSSWNSVKEGTKAKDKDKVLRYLPKHTREQIKKQIRSTVLGIELHDLFRLLKFYPREKILSLLEGKVGLGQITEEKRGELNEALDYVCREQNPSLLSLAARGHAEWGFSFRLREHTLVGRIDFWGRDEQGQLFIIDYKTGPLSSSSLSQARLQLKIYALALLACGRAKREEPLHLGVLYPQEERKESFTFLYEDLFAEEAGIFNTHNE